MAADCVPDGPSEQHRRRGTAQGRVTHNQAEGEHSEEHEADRTGMAERDRQP